MKTRTDRKYITLLCIVLFTKVLDACKPSDCDTLHCQDVHDPVCGSNGQTFSNRCYLKMDNCQRSCDEQIDLVENRECASTPKPSHRKKSPDSCKPSDCENLACLDVYDPVCGSDGKNYSNAYHLELENCNRPCDQQIYIASNEECASMPNPSHRKTTKADGDQCDSLCPHTDDPVCGSDGLTYQSACQLSLENCKRRGRGRVRKVGRGPCKTTAQPYFETPLTSTTAEHRNCNDIVCPPLEASVCGSDGNVYSNTCFMIVENCKRSLHDQISITYNDACGNTIYTPVYTTTSESTAQTTNCDDIQCRDVYDQVCGSDGQTYGSQCALDVENCRRPPYDQISKVYSGECETTTTTVTYVETSESTAQTRNCDDILCRVIYDPVCCSDGQTYGSQCTVDVENCRRPPYDQISIVYGGECETTTTTATYIEPPATTPRNCDNIGCLDVYDPVCGSDGQIYRSQCTLDVENCRRPPYDQIAIAYRGECKTTTTYATPPETTLRNCDIWCQDNYDPVCGSDSQTYGNECALDVENCQRHPYDPISIAYRGECKTTTNYATPPETTLRNCDIWCQDIYDPVCGSDGQTYDNECALDVENCRRPPYDPISLAYRGECETTTTYATPPETTPRNCDDIRCLVIYDPVCGSDGQTYGNDCVLDVENCRRSSDDQISVVYRGDCTKTTTYATTDVEAIPEDCTMPCPDIDEPVCGSDGTTYANPCELRAANCLQSPYEQMTILRDGECQTTPESTVEKYTPVKPVCSLGCPKNFDPVCGADGVTYSNPCLLRVANCRRSPYNQITIVFPGSCEAAETTTEAAITTTKTPPGMCPLACTRDFFPVCGSDGRTYGNPCELRVENCVQSPYNQATIVTYGACNSIPATTPTTGEDPLTTPAATPRPCTLLCLAVSDPVCGSDGVTYDNPCKLRVANCKGSPEEQVVIVSNSSCPITTLGSTPTAITSTAIPTTPSVTPTPGACPLACPLIVDPVCGSDGTTFSNACALRAENCLRSAYDQVTLVNSGACEATTTSGHSAVTSVRPMTEPTGSDKVCTLLCLAVSDPVCGSDGVTYDNPCELRVANCNGSPYAQVTIVGIGACRTTTTSTTASTTASTNASTTASTTTTIITTGTFTPTTPAVASTTVNCKMECEYTKEPVCGSDGVTYPNLCAVQLENCSRSPEQQVTVVGQGACTEIPAADGS